MTVVPLILRDNDLSLGCLTLCFPVKQTMAGKGDAWAEREVLIATGKLAEKERADRQRKIYMMYHEVRKFLEQWKGGVPQAVEMTSEGKPAIEVDEVACVKCVEEGTPKTAKLSRKEALELQNKWHE